MQRCDCWSLTCGIKKKIKGYKTLIHTFTKKIEDKRNDDNNNNNNNINNSNNNNNNNDNNNNNNNSDVKHGWNKNNHVSIQHIKLYELSEVTACIIKYTAILILNCLQELINNLLNLQITYPIATNKSYQSFITNIVKLK